MSIILKNQKNLIAQLSGGIGSTDITIKHFHGREAISELFEFTVIFLADSDSLDLEKALGASVTITIKSDKQERYISGIIAEFSQGAVRPKTDGYLTEYTVVIRPELWLLTLDRNQLMFQKKTAIDIIKQVLKDGGVSNVSDKTKSCGKVEREYCVQYAESSFNFVSRLMEDEGIFYFFKHENGKDTLVLADSSSAHEKIKTSDIKFAKGSEEVFSVGQIFNTSITAAVNTGGYACGDHNYTISSTKLYSKLDSQYKGQKYYEYPGGFAKTKEGDDISKLRVELFEFKHKLFSASSTVANLAPGFSFKLTDHHASAFNKEYIVYEIEHFYDASAPDGFIYRNNFRAFEKGVEFRPPRRAYHPRIYGTQTAIVVCSSGEEIYRNEHCCVKVHFYWDQIGKDKDAEDSSCWIRVAQLLAGSSWGAVFIPRVGQEVVVSFIEGDPDRPLIVGCVYNDQFMPPYSDKESMLSGIKMATFKDTDAKMFNEFRFNDEKDKQEIYVHAEKDMYINILNSRKTEIEESDDTLELFKGNRSITLKAEGDNPANHTVKLTKGDSIVELTEGNRKYTLTKGNEEVTLTEGNRTVTMSKGNEDITLSEGNRTVTLSKGNDSLTLSEGNQTVTLSKGDLKYDITGNYTITLSGDLKIKADGNINIEAGKAISMKSGTDFKEEAGTKMQLKSGTDLNVESGTNFKAKSGLNMNVEAGMNLELKGTMQTKLSGMMTEVSAQVQGKFAGAMVEISGTGMTKVSAPMITIGGGMLQLG